MKGNIIYILGVLLYVLVLILKSKVQKIQPVNLSEICCHGISPILLLVFQSRVHHVHYIHLHTLHISESTERRFCIEILLHLHYKDLFASFIFKFLYIQ